MIILKLSHIFRQASYDIARCQSESVCTEYDEVKKDIVFAIIKYLSEIETGSKNSYLLSTFNVCPILSRLVCR